jgi:hypothetical protein
MGLARHRTKKVCQESDQSPIKGWARRKVLEMIHLERHLVFVAPLHLAVALVQGSALGPYDEK